MTKQSKLAVVLIILVCIIMLAACNPTSTNNDSMFIRCEGYPSSKSYYVVYHKDTKVMYAVSTGKQTMVILLFSSTQMALRCFGRAKYDKMVPTR